MSSMQPSIIKQATQHFRKGDYQRAKVCYQQAGELYGRNLFANSVRLCELRMGKPAPASTPKPAATARPSSASSVTEQQLADTQNLLEHYYTRCQELEYQLLDRT